MINVCIVGVGLMGGSLGQALRGVQKNGKRLYHVSGLGRSSAHLIKAKKLGAVDIGSTKADEVIPQADIVVLCTPVQSIVSVTATFLNDLKPGAFITDAGSVKGAIEKEMHYILRARPDVFFVGAHPLAGSEKFGVENAKADLYRNAICAVTNGKNKVVAKMWKDAGCKIISVGADVHDEILALTSHLPHVLAFALFSEAMKASKKSKFVKAFIAGSFSDMTRIAASEPRMWQGIFDLNRKHILNVKNSFNKTVDQLLKMKSTQLSAVLQEISDEKHRWHK